MRCISIAARARRPQQPRAHAVRSALASLLLSAALVTGCAPVVGEGGAGDDGVAASASVAPTAQPSVNARVRVDDAWLHGVGRDAALELFFPVDGARLTRYTDVVLETTVRLSADVVLESIELVGADGSVTPLPDTGWQLSEGFALSGPPPWIVRASLPLSDPLVAVGGRVRVRAHDDDGVYERSRIVAGGDTALNVLSVADGGDGVVWVGTSHDGLIGLRLVDDQVVGSIHYAGGAIFSARAPDAKGPRGAMIPRMARQGDGLWLGSWARGLSYLDPGADALSRLDDTWRHVTPPGGDDSTAIGLDEAGLLAELRETTTALLPDGADGLWVGTLDGLWHLHHGGVGAGGLDPSEWTWQRVSDGVIMALAHDGDGGVWVGTSSAIEVPGTLPSWTQAKAPLLHVREGATAWVVTPIDLCVLVSEPTGCGASVLALAQRDAGDDVGADRVLWVGGDRGLLAVRVGEALAQGSFDAITVGARWIEDELGDRDVMTLAPDGDDGLWVGAFDQCESDGGALVHLAHGGSATVKAGDVIRRWTAEDGLADADVSMVVPLGEGRVIFSTFDLPLAGPLAALLGLDGKRRDEGCVNPPGVDGLTILDLGNAATGEPERLVEL